MKNFLKALSILAFGLMSLTVFAAEPATSYKTTIEPISVALQKRLTVGGNGPSTDIIVINYTNTEIVLTNPTYNKLPPRNSARIVNDSYSGNTLINLNTSYGQTFFNTYVWNHATVSVDLVNGNYAVNVR